MILPPAVYRDHPGIVGMLPAVAADQIYLGYGRGPLRHSDQGNLLDSLR